MDAWQVLTPFGAALAAYLVGSLSFAVIVSRLMGLADPRTFGSKNPGATNVLRSGSKAAAVVTLLLDAGKGWLPVLLVRLYGEQYGMGAGTVALVAFCAFVGHLYPLYFRFKGGKGVATALGVLIGLNAWLGLVALLVWVFMALVFRISSLASMTSALITPLAYLMGDGGLWESSRPVGAAVVAMCLLLMYRHAGNINRLVKGTEPRLGKKSAAPGAAATQAQGKAGGKGPSAHGH